MEIFGVGTGELLLILVIAVVVVGPERMVEFARDAGRWLAKFRQETEGVSREFREAFDLSLEEEADEESVEDVTPGEKEPQPVPAVSGAQSPEEAEPPVEEEPEPGTDLERRLARSMVDGEIEIRGRGETEEHLVRDDGPVPVNVAEPILEDEEIEPQVASQVVLIEGEAAEESRRGEE